MRMLGSNPTDSQVQDLVNAKDFDGKKCACAAVGFKAILPPEPKRFRSAVTKRTTLLTKTKPEPEIPGSGLIAHANKISNDFWTCVERVTAVTS